MTDLPNVGGKWGNLPDGEAHGKGDPPEKVMKVLEEYARNGIVISGVITWISIQRDQGACNIWKEAALQGWSPDEVAEAKAELLAAMDSLTLDEMKKNTKFKDFKLVRTGGSKTPRKTLDINDIIMMLEFLSDKERMPLVLASPEQIRRCPKTLGSVSPDATVGELLSKVSFLETTLAGHMEASRRQLEILTETMLEQRVQIPERRIATPGSASKRIRSEEYQDQEVMEVSQRGSYAGATKFMSGIQPIQRQHPVPVQSQQQLFRKNMFKNMQKETTDKGNTKKKIFHGNSISEEQANENYNFAADVDLVAFNVAKNVEPEQLKAFLKEKGLEVEVECMTRPELLLAKKVRSKTMRVSVKASDHERALNPELWPFRVGVRHYKAKPRRLTSDGNSAGGHMEETPGDGGGGGGHLGGAGGGSQHPRQEHVIPGSREWGRKKNRRNQYQEQEGWQVPVQSLDQNTITALRNMLSQCP